MKKHILKVWGKWKGWGGEIQASTKQGGWQHKLKQEGKEFQARKKTWKDKEWRGGCWQTWWCLQHLDLCITWETCYCALLVLESFTAVWSTHGFRSWWLSCLQHIWCSSTAAPSVVLRRTWFLVPKPLCKCKQCWLREDYWGIHFKTVLLV